MDIEPINDFNDLDDNSLVELSLKGEPRAYDILFTRYRRPLGAMLQGRVNNKLLREDIIQDSFIKAYFNLDKFDPQYTFGQWIFTIARNLHIDHTRRQRTAALPLDDVNTPCQAPNPEQRIIWTQNGLHLERILASMPENYQQVLRLRFWDGLSYEEIAATLNMPMGTIKTQIHRARTSLGLKLGIKSEE